MMKLPVMNKLMTLGAFILVLLLLGISQQATATGVGAGPVEHNRYDVSLSGDNGAPYNGVAFSQAIVLPPSTSGIVYVAAAAKGVNVIQAHPLNEVSSKSTAAPKAKNQALNLHQPLAGSTLITYTYDNNGNLIGKTKVAAP